MDKTGLKVDEILIPSPKEDAFFAMGVIGPTRAGKTRFLANFFKGAYPVKFAWTGSKHTVERVYHLVGVQRSTDEHESGNRNAIENSVPSSCEYQRSTYSECNIKDGDTLTNFLFRKVIGMSDDDADTAMTDIDIFIKKLGKRNDMREEGAPTGVVTVILDDVQFILQNGKNNKNLVSFMQVALHHGGVQMIYVLQNPFGNKIVNIIRQSHYIVYPKVEGNLVAQTMNSHNFSNIPKTDKDYLKQMIISLKEARTPMQCLFLKQEEGKFAFSYGIDPEPDNLQWNFEHFGIDNDANATKASGGGSDDGTYIEWRRTSVRRFISIPKTLIYRKRPFPWASPYNFESDDI